MSPRARLILFAGVLATALPAALPADAGTPCSSTCRTTLQVGAKPVRWHSLQTFADRAPVEITLKANGRELEADPVRDCAARFYGQGVVARVEACGKPRSRIRVRAVNVEKRPARLSILYRAG